MSNRSETEGKKKIGTSLNNNLHAAEQSTMFKLKYGLDITPHFTQKQKVDSD
jgi:hypothetical protein